MVHHYSCRHCSWYRTVAVFLLLSTLLISVGAEATSSTGHTGGTAVGFSAEPILISEGRADLPVERLLKRGVEEGGAVIEVDLDKTGAVERCTVRKGIDSEFDSLVAAAMYRARFTPAYEQGSAVPSTIAMRFSFSPQAIVRNCGDGAPSIYGSVLETGTNLPVPDALVRLQVTDSLADNELTLPLRDYLTLIGDAPGQSELSGILSTHTDSLGRFAFRLLPSCPVRMAVIAGGFEAAHARVTVTSGMTQKITCRLEPIATDSSIDMVVYGSPPDRARVDIEEEQLASGLTHYLSEVLKAQVTIRSVPESRSRMMVRAGSPFDNRYYICGIPMLAPFHFGGHSYADIDGMMISALSEIDLTIDGIAGKQLDVSGFRIDAQPGIYRPANRELIRRPELSVDFNTIGQDFLLSLPRKETEDALQLGFTRSENYTLLFFDSRRQYEENEYRSPVGYGNITVSGVGNVGSVRLHSFSWFAWDNYKGQTPIPWGMAAVTLRSEKQKGLEINVGGSRQYFATGRRVGNDKYRIFSSCNNGVARISFDSLEGQFLNATVDVATEMQQWEGSINRTWLAVSDSTWERGFTHYVWKDSTASVLQTSGNNEMSLQTHGTLSTTLGPFTAAIDLLGVGLLYNNKTDVIADGGLSLTWKSRYVEAGINGGQVTSRPDIRGLPDSRFRRTHCHSYLFSVPILLRFGSEIRFGLQPYLRKKTNEPKLDPAKKVWNPGESSPVYAAGMDIDGECRPAEWLSFFGAVNIARSYREYGGVREGYEWDVPWTGRWGIHTQFGTESQMHFYLKGIAAKGLPFYDFARFGDIRAPDYFRLDFSMQYRSRIEHRFLTRYDAYFNVFNLTDHYNVSDYYWDESMGIRPVIQGEIMIEMGVRLGFRV